MRFRAVLSSTTTQSAQLARRRSVSNELYGCTTTSLNNQENAVGYQRTINKFKSYLISSWLGNTLYVWIIFFGKWSDNRSMMYEPIPDPVPPAIEWHSTNPSRLSLPSASRSIMSNTSSCNVSPWLNPEAQLLPAPPPFLDTKIFSGLYSCKNAIHRVIYNPWMSDMFITLAYGELIMVWMTRGSRSSRTALGI